MRCSSRGRCGSPRSRVAALELFKRLTLIVHERRIEKVFYPVFPPDQNAEEVLAWLRKNAQPSAPRTLRDRAAQPR